MSILHIITSTDVGGSERMLQKLILNSRNKGNHSILSLKPIGAIGQELIDAGVNVYSLDINKLHSILHSWKMISKIIRIEKVELIQTWLYHADLFGSVIGLFFRLPVVWNIRQTKFDNNDPIVTKIIMKLCAVLSYFIPVKIICAANASALQHKKYGYKYLKMHVISNGFLDNIGMVPPQAILELKEKLKLSQSDLVIGAVGRYHPIKDYDTFLNASKDLAIIYPQAKFLLVGRDLDYNNIELCNKIRSLNIQDKVILVGEQIDINPYLLSMDAFCLTSISEGFPNVLAEAMIMAIPSFSTKCGDAQIILNDSNFLVEIGDYKTLAASLIKFFNLNNDDRAEIGKQQRAIVLKNYSIAKIVDQYWEVYNIILKKQKSCVDL